MPIIYEPTGGAGGSGTVKSVTAGDTSIVVGGTAVNPTVETADLATIASDHPTAGDVALNAHKITGLANGVAATDAATVGQLSGGTVTSVTAADTSIVVSGTASAPTVRTGTLDVIATDHPAAADWSNAAHKITSVKDPTLAQDVATKNYVDTNTPGNGNLHGKGSLITATAANTPANIDVGTDGQVLTADSAQSTGLKYSYPSVWGGLVVPIGAPNIAGVSTGFALTANSAFLCRVVIPVTGTLHDLAVCITANSGTIDIGIYDTAATTRNRLYHSGGVAVSGNGWHTVADPAMAVTAGDNYDFAVLASAGTLNLARASAVVTQQYGPLPANFLPGAGGSPLLGWTVATGVTALPSTLTEAASGQFPPIIIARIS